MVTMMALKTAILIEKMAMLNKIYVLPAFLLIFGSNVIAETWICSYLHNGKIETNRYKRLNDSQFLYENTKSTDKIYLEDTQHITLTFSHGIFGMNVAILDKENKRFISSNTSFKGAYSWNGDCEVVE